MFGYESITQDLMHKRYQNGKMYKQFEKKLEICIECLQSIDRMLDTIRLSYCPIELKIYEEDGSYCIYNSVQREKS